MISACMTCIVRRALKQMVGAPCAVTEWPSPFTLPQVLSLCPGSGQAKALRHHIQQQAQQQDFLQRRQASLQQDYQVHMHGVASQAHCQQVRGLCTRPSGS